MKQAVYICPHCDFTINCTDGCEEYTVGSIASVEGRETPHIICPVCKECIACEKRNNDRLHS